MEKSVKPDRKYLVKSIWILLTITGCLLLLTGIMHLIIFLAGNGREAFIITWIIFAGAILIIWAIAYPTCRLVIPTYAGISSTWTFCFALLAKYQSH